MSTRWISALQWARGHTHVPSIYWGQSLKLLWLAGFLRMTAWVGYRWESSTPSLLSFPFCFWFSLSPLLFPLSPLSLPLHPPPLFSLHLLQPSCFLQPCKFWILTTPCHPPLLIQFPLIPVNLEHLRKVKTIPRSGSAFANLTLSFSDAIFLKYALSWTWNVYFCRSGPGH